MLRRRYRSKSSRTAAVIDKALQAIRSARGIQDTRALDEAYEQALAELPPWQRSIQTRLDAGCIREVREFRKGGKSVLWSVLRGCSKSSKG